MDQKISTIRFEASAKLPTDFGLFTIHAFTEKTSDGVKNHAALVMGVPQDGCLVRVHSACATSEIFGSRRCDCAEQLEMAKWRVAQEGVGVVIYLDQEGRDIGFANKIRAYHLQDQGADTVEANERLGLPADARRYDAADYMLRHFELNAFRLLTNNPKKVAALVQRGFAVAREPLIMPVQPDNRAYMLTKQIRMGHLYDVREALHA